MIILLCCLSLLIAAVQFSTVNSALPCDSPLRQYLPQDFTHCPSCSYGQWSPWIGSIPPQVQTTTCDSGKAKKLERSRTAVPGSTCTPDTATEYKYECEPTLKQKAELIIQSLRLGVFTDRGGAAGRPGVQSSINYCPSDQANNRICPNICPRGKRSFDSDEEEFTMLSTPGLKVLDSAVPVEPFRMEGRVSAIHERRRRQRCRITGSRYVLFIVDTSGSIGESTFNKVRDLLASISETLCGHLRVAMITYSSDINLEFCFNCYSDRRDIFNAIKRVRYRGGWTHTTDATKCACQTMLTTGCGLPRGSSTPDIDIVFLTDGYHNGPCQSNLKMELDCFHTRTNINTYAIAIGSAALQSVKAMENPRDASDSHIFNVDDFAQLDELLKLILKILSLTNPDGDPVYTCFSHDQACRK